MKGKGFLDKFCNGCAVGWTILLLTNIMTGCFLYHQMQLCGTYKNDIEQKRGELQQFKKQIREEVEAQKEMYYAQQIQKLLPDQELTYLAQNHWQYVLTLNGKQVTEDIVYLKDPAAHIVLAEVVKELDILPRSILKKGTITGGDPLDRLQDHLRMMTNAAYTIAEEETPQGRRVVYDLKEVPSGTIINLKPSILLVDRLGFGEEGMGRIEIIRNE